MADDLRRRGLQPRDPRDDTQYPKQEDDDRLRTQPPQHHRSNGSNMAAAGPITLPSIHDYPPTAQRGPPPPHDQPRSAYSLSPTESDNGPPPPGKLTTSRQCMQSTAGDHHNLKTPGISKAVIDPRRPSQGTPITLDRHHRHVRAVTRKMAVTLRSTPTIRHRPGP
ncbi:hypothetical protein MCOR02_000401 [Pyricularia oryzae]|nr:hypothetical protein MCOR02_000401 [Pyricularia oryzae]